MARAGAFPGARSLLLSGRKGPMIAENVSFRSAGFSGSLRMMAGGEGAGGGTRHVPVMLREVISFLAPKPGGLYLDATFGAGGYSRALLEAGSRVVALDRDPNAIRAGAALVEESRGRLTLVEERFSALDQAADEPLDGVVLDLGVSSMQLDEAARGFSFRADGPLDMRMEGQGLSAADVVNTYPVKDLARIIATLGEENHARAVARAIVAARPIERTDALADIVRGVVRPGPGIDPATRTFQALRMFVNDELGELSAALAAAERALKESGRLVVVSFHSLEDRLVKTFLTARGREARGSRHQPELENLPPTFRLLTKKPATAAEDEVARNPRARSAKLRAAERTDVAPRADDALAALLDRFPAQGRGR
jgi:16S rRNA (cytosine1402-N4)-methyltransferase